MARRPAAGFAPRSPRNWLGRVPNPFNVLMPPPSFLASLAVFDADAVIFPSSKNFGYWFCRRRTRTAGIMTTAALNADTTVMAQHNLVAVCFWGGSITWGPAVLQWLRDRDQWAFKNADEVHQTFLDEDARQDAAYKRWREGENDARAHSMYATLKTRSGERVHLGDANRGRGPIKPKARVSTSTAPALAAPVPPTPGGWSATGSGIVIPPL